LHKSIDFDQNRPIFIIILYNVTCNPGD